MNTPPFGSHKIIREQISESELCSYLVGFDLNDKGTREYRWRPLVQVLLNVLQEFAFGFHEGTVTENIETLPKLIDAAKAIYKIDAFQKARDIYKKYCLIDNELEDKYLKRGEFGELILHLLLRDFHETIPLISKIYFKDSFGHAVHGFDAVHIQPKTKTLWLGESKLYIDPKKGLKALINDIKEHIQSDYLNSEFSIISKKIKHFDNIQQKDYWIGLLDKSTKLSEQIASINIPLLCTYSCELFSIYDDEGLDEFIEKYENEIKELKKYFDENNDHPLKTDLNIILLLFPIKCKIELVKRLHSKLYHIQAIGD